MSIDGGESPRADLSALRLPFSGTDVATRRGIGDFESQSSGVGGGDDAANSGTVDVLETDAELTNQRFVGRRERQVRGDKEKDERGLFEELVGALDRVDGVDGRQEGRGRDADARERVAVDEESRFDAGKLDPSEGGFEAFLRGAFRFFVVGIKSAVDSIGGRGREERGDERGRAEDVTPCRGGESRAVEGTRRALLGLGGGGGIFGGGVIVGRRLDGLKSSRFADCESQSEIVP